MLYIANVGVNRRVMKVKHLPVEMTLSSATTYGKHLRNTSRQDLKNRLCRKTIDMVLSADNAIRRSRMTLSE
ncbi:hypothetical protein SFK404_1799 [Shigella flexneri K-404]|nr:hypothetical protein SFK404_1799 [Shigella flexneri K-404]